MDLSLKIYNILLKKKYSRGCPLFEKEIVKIIKDSIYNNEPIKLVGFWGAGSKNKADSVDKKSCEFLNSLNDEIKSVYSPGLKLTFIFATMHAIHNGYDDKNIDSYINEIRKIFEKFKFEYVFLDEYWKKYKITFEKIDSLLKTKVAGWWNNIPGRELIEKNASNRNKRYPAIIAAQKYYIMRQLEKDMLEKEFNGFIFHAFASPELAGVLPNMPTLYLWGTKKYHSEAPWFSLEI